MQNISSFNHDLIQTPEHRKLVESVVNSERFALFLDKVDSYKPKLNIPQGKRNIQIVKQEMRDAGLICSDAVAHDLNIMQQLLVPTTDDALSLMLTRLHLLATDVDDVCSDNRENICRLLSAIGKKENDSLSPYCEFIDYMFEETVKFFSPESLAILRIFFMESVVGILLEAELLDDPTNAIDTQYIRLRSWFCAFWFGMLQFLHPSLDFINHAKLWSAALNSMADFLIDINDVSSFDKEAIPGNDFVTSRIYRRSVHEGISYVDAFWATLESGERAERHIISLANESQRPYVETFIK
ncbi:MAG: hypothetical protein ACRCXC_09825 [Legionella sp.]